MNIFLRINIQIQKMNRMQNGDFCIFICFLSNRFSEQPAEMHLDWKTRGLSTMSWFLLSQSRQLSLTDTFSVHSFIFSNCLVRVTVIYYKSRYNSYSWRIEPMKFIRKILQGLRNCQSQDFTHHADIAEGRHCRRKWGNLEGSVVERKCEMKEG